VAAPFLLRLKPARSRRRRKPLVCQCQRAPAGRSGSVRRAVEPATSSSNASPHFRWSRLHARAHSTAHRQSSSAPRGRTGDLDGARCRVLGIVLEVECGLERCHINGPLHSTNTLNPALTIRATWVCNSTSETARPTVWRRISCRLQFVSLVNIRVVHLRASYIARTGFARSRPLSGLPRSLKRRRNVCSILHPSASTEEAVFFSPTALVLNY
jgi:hypothetical protein